MHETYSFRAHMVHLTKRNHMLGCKARRRLVRGQPRLKGCVWKWTKLSRTVQERLSERWDMSWDSSSGVLWAPVRTGRSAVTHCALWLRRTFSGLISCFTSRPPALLDSPGETQVSHLLNPGCDSYKYHTFPLIPNSNCVSRAQD